MTFEFFFPSLLQIMLELKSFIFTPKLWILIIMIHVQVLVDCSGDDRSEKSPEMAFSNKKSALLQLVEGSPVPKTIVFCNKVRWSILPLWFTLVVPVCYYKHSDFFPF